MVRKHEALVLTAVATLLWTGCGVKKDVHRRVVEELHACQGTLGTCQSDKAAADARVTELEGELDTTRKARDDEAAARKQAEAQLEELGSNLEASKEELKVLRDQRAATQRRLEAFRQLNERFRALVDTGKLEVVFRNGMMVLKLPAGILFASGRADLSKDGEAALTEVLAILLEFKDRRFMIAGHTDNVKIKSRKFGSNWELSAARAISVVEFMIENGFAPENLAAAGYGEFDPVAPNDTPENKQLNRRIEIVLVPDLSELPNLTEQADDAATK